MHKLLVHLIPPTILPKAKTIERRTCSRQTRTFQAVIPQLSPRLLLPGGHHPATFLCYKRDGHSVANRAPSSLPAGKRVTRVVGFSRSACSCIVFNGTICFWALHLELNYFVRVRDVGEVEEVPQCLQWSQSLLLYLGVFFFLSLFCIIDPCRNALHCKITY